VTDRSPWDPPTPDARLGDDNAPDSLDRQLDPDNVVDAAELHERPWWAPLPLIAFVGLVICGYIGTAVSVRWANTNPEGLLALHARVRHLLLALGGDVSIPAYVVIGGLRLALAFVVCHLIGRAYGAAILHAFIRYLGATRKQIDDLSDGIERYEWLLVPFFVGSNLLAAITGIQLVSARRIAVYLAVGISLRLLFWWWIAQIFDDELDRVLDFFGTYQQPLLIASIIAVIAVVGLNVVRGRGAGS
jgi:hypothetical protein